MRLSKRLRGKYRKGIRIYLRACIGALFVGALLFALMFQVKTITVEGNTSYTEEEIKDMVLTGPLRFNSFLISKKDTSKDTKDIPFIKSIEIRQTGRNSILIQVNEKQLAGYIRYLDGYLFLNKEGVVTESTVEPIKGVPLVDGLKFDHILLNEKLPTGDKEIFTTIMGISRMVEKNAIPIDRISVGEANQITLHTGSVSVQMGKDEHMEEKITHLAAILPKLEGMEGTLHLEGVTNTSTNITFERATDTQNGEAVENESESANAFVR